MTGPCKGCQRRKPGCHGNCERYLNWRAGLEERRRSWINEHMADTVLARAKERRLKFQRRVAGRGTVYNKEEE